MEERSKPIGLIARLYIALIVAAGLACFIDAVAGWHCSDAGRYTSYLGIAVLASVLKVRLPGIRGTMSVNYVFVLLGILELSRPETVALACVAIAVQTGWRATAQTKWLHIVFNCASMALATTAGYLVYRATNPGSRILPLAIAASASVFFVFNTLAVAGIVSLTERKNLIATWHECYFWSFPYYLAGAAIAALLSACSRHFGWQSTVLVLPVLYFFYRSYRLYLSKLESEKCHAEQMAALHLRTIEALALAIEAKDDNTHAHIERVQVYAVELGKALKLPEEQLQALRAASILHDIGKLAVPEHIISKPGKLTPEEFEKSRFSPTS